MHRNRAGDALKYEEHYTIEDYHHWDGEWELIYGL